MHTLTLNLDPRELSHELRIPLTGILGSVELLSITEQLTSEQKEQLELIRQSGTRLLTVVNLILNNIKEEEPANDSAAILTKFFNLNR